MKPNMTTVTPWKQYVPTMQGSTYSTETKTYVRNYTYGQGMSLKFMTNKFLKRLGINLYMYDLVLNLTRDGDPGYPNTYRVRIRTREKH